MFQFSFEFSDAKIAFNLKVRCVRFRGIQQQNVVEMEYNIHEHVFISV